MRDEQMSSESLIKELNVLRRELSDRKRSEQVAADFLDQAPMAIHWVGPDGLILWANKAELQMLGYTSEEFLGQHIADFHVEKPVIDDILKRLASAETLNNYPAQLRCKDGSVKKVMINSNVRWEDGKFIHTRCFTRDVTEHALAMEALRQVDERLRLISKATSDVVWDWDLTANRLFWGSSFEVLFGYSFDDLEPGIESWHYRIHPDDHDRVFLGIKEFLARQEVNWSDEYQFKCKDGTYVNIFDRGTAIYDKDGKAVRMVGAMVDITDRKKSERTLQESELRFRTLSENSSVGIFQTNIEGQCLYVNSRYTDITGMTAQQALSEGWVQCLHSDDRDRVLGAWQQWVQSEKPFSIEYRFVKPDGEIVWVLGVAFALRNEKNVITGFIGNLIDITGRKHNESIIHENEQKYRQILDAINDMVLVKGPQSKIIWANKAFRDYYGMTNEQLENLVDAPFNDPDNTQQYVKDDVYVFETGNVLNIPEELVTSHDGKVRFFHTVKSAILNSDGQVVMTVGLSRDVTDRKLSEEELKKNIEELKLLLAITVDRENTMINLKKEVNALALELKRSQPYDVSFLTNEQ